MLFRSVSQSRYIDQGYTNWATIEYGPFQEDHYVQTIRLHVVNAGNRDVYYKITDSDGVELKPESFMASGLFVAGNAVDFDASITVPANKSLRLYVRTELSSGSNNPEIAVINNQVAYQLLGRVIRGKYGSYDGYLLRYQSTQQELFSLQQDRPVENIGLGRNLLEELRPAFGDTDVK